jgi:hypothetical protein
VSHQASSFDESSYFFDELNKDETALHNCNSVNAYNLWPKIINNVTISLDPLKNKEMKSSIKLNDLVSKVSQSTCYPSLLKQESNMVIRCVTNQNDYEDQPDDYQTDEPVKKDE